MLYFNNVSIKIMSIINSIIYILIGFIIYSIICYLIKRTTNKKILKKRHHQKRANTINSLIINVFKYLIIIIVIAIILSEFGIDVKSIFAGIGIIAAILGLAFQDIAKDFLAGISIVIEDQYEIGDTVEINGFIGEVVSLGLRTTRIKNFKGQTMIIANHTISKVINYNLENTKAIVDVLIGYEYSSEEVEKTLEKMCNKLDGTIPQTRGKIQILGINDMTSSGVVYRLAVETKSAEHITVERILRKEIKNALTAAKIKIPYKQIEVHNGNKIK